MSCSICIIQQNVNYFKQNQKRVYPQICHFLDNYSLVSNSNIAYTLAALFNFILVLRSFFFVQLFNYFSTPDTRLFIIFVKVFIIFVGFILRKLTKTSLRKQPSIRHSLQLWISPIHFPSSIYEMLIFFSIYLSPPIIFLILKIPCS